VLVCDPTVSPEQARAHEAALVDRDAVLARSDYLCLLCPLTPATKGMIGAAELRKMKPSTVLVNTGRGELVDETAACLTRYCLLPKGAKVIVALSGGEDSWSSLALLRELTRLDRLLVELSAVHIDLGFPGADERNERLHEGCAKLHVPLHIVSTQIGTTALAAKKKQPCFICARQRRQALFTWAAEQGATHLVTGHHRDDVLTTFLLNLLENREVSTLVPSQPVFNGRFHLIRPLFAISKERIHKLALQQRFAVTDSGCPIAGKTKRQTALELLQEIERRFPNAREALFTALHRVKPSFLPPASR